MSGNYFYNDSLRFLRHCRPSERKLRQPPVTPKTNQLERELDSLEITLCHPRNELARGLREKQVPGQIIYQDYFACVMLILGRRPKLSPVACGDVTVAERLPPVAFGLI